jgi:hypothetical protein
MKILHSPRYLLLTAIALPMALSNRTPAQVLTVQVGAPAPPPTPLVSRGDAWHYRKGTSEPQADWKDAPDSGLDGTWLTGPGGFGFGDGDDATVLTDMLNGYNTVYIRRSFDIPAGIDPSRRVVLVMDWDDGFVAYLDGVEVARSPNVAVASPLFNSQTVAGQNHEASAGAGGNPPTTYDLGSVGALLVPGTHVLAVHGLNSDPASSDFSLIADLRLEDRVILEGIGGVLATNTTWSPDTGPVNVVSNLIVPAGVTLTVQAGVVVRFAGNVSLIAAGGGVIDIAGTMENKVHLMPLNGTNLWGQLSAQFAGSSLTVRHADIGYAQVTVYSNAVGLLEDCFIHDYRRPGGSLFTAPILLTHFAAPTTVRRCHVREYHETLWRNGVLTIEGCLFENISGDAVDFDSAQTGTVIRHCTFRHGTLGNVDAVDVGPGDMPGAFDVRIENCMMYDFPRDKGVSVGDNNSSRGTIVSNCFIYACLSGVQAKDRCDVSVRHCTIVDNNWGFTNYNKVNPSSPTGGGILTNCYNNILWNNGITISMVNDSRLYADHNNFSNTNWPGEGNIDVDPLFLNPAGRDYRLAANSPCRGAGRDGADLGAVFPVGSPLALSHPRIESFGASGSNTVARFWADNEKTYSLLCSPVVSGGTWTKVADVPLGTVPRLLSITNSIASGHRFYRLVTPAQP